MYQTIDNNVNGPERLEIYDWTQNKQNIEFVEIIVMSCGRVSEPVRRDGLSVNNCDIRRVSVKNVLIHHKLSRWYYCVAVSHASPHIIAHEHVPNVYDTL